MKYKLGDKHPTLNLFRVIALKDFNGVTTGDIGGYISSEDNLSQEGNAWVYGDAKVSGDAKVYSNAKVFGNAEVSGDAEVYGDVRVSGNAWVFGNTLVFGDAWVSGDAEVYGAARVSGNAKVSGNALVYGNALVNKTPIVIDGLSWQIVIDDVYTSVGCHQHTSEEWLGFSEEEIAAMAPSALEFYPTLVNIINTLAIPHQKD